MVGSENVWTFTNRHTVCEVPEPRKNGNSGLIPNFFQQMMSHIMMGFSIFAIKMLQN